MKQNQLLEQFQIVTSRLQSNRIKRISYSQSEMSEFFNFQMFLLLLYPFVILRIQDNLISMQVPALLPQVLYKSEPISTVVLLILLYQRHCGRLIPIRVFSVVLEKLDLDITQFRHSAAVMLGCCYLQRRRQPRFTISVVIFRVKFLFCS